MREYVDANLPGIEEIVTMRQFLPKLILDNPMLGDIIINIKWEVFSVGNCGLDLLLSDRPCLQFGGLADVCVILLPISPIKLFVAGDTSFHSASTREIVRFVNRAAINASMDRVYATGTQHAALLAKWAKGSGTSR
jgi:hypothetical protein